MSFCFVCLFLTTAKSRVADGIPIPLFRHSVVEWFVCIFLVHWCKQRKFTVPNYTSCVEVFSLFQSGLITEGDLAFYPEQFRGNCFSSGFILRLFAWLFVPHRHSIWPRKGSEPVPSKISSSGVGFIGFSFLFLWPRRLLRESRRARAERWNRRRSLP